MKKSSAKALPEIHLETVVVGAGPAGLSAARFLQQSNPDMQILVLDAATLPEGRLSGGLHLCNSIEGTQMPLQLGAQKNRAKVRWERRWVGQDEVNWKDKDWVAQIPQWNLYLDQPKFLIKGLKDTGLEVAVRSQSPASVLSKIENGDRTLWKIETPAKVYLCSRVIWACGLTAFQNAFGKIAAQAYLAPNPRFNEDAMDYRGGIALELSLPAGTLFEEGFDENAVFALPVRHSGQLHLLLGIVERSPEEVLLRTLTHVHSDMLVDPKELLSFQKSLKRALKSLCNPHIEAETKLKETWVVNPLVGGNILGLRGVLGKNFDDGLEFVGDESLAAAESPYTDTLAALASVRSLKNLEPQHDQMLALSSDGAIPHAPLLL